MLWCSMLSRATSWLGRGSCADLEPATHPTEAINGHYRTKQRNHQRLPQPHQLPTPNAPHRQRPRCLHPHSTLKSRICSEWRSGWRAAAALTGRQWGFCTTWGPGGVRRRRVAAPCSAKAPVRSGNLSERPRQSLVVGGIKLTQLGVVGHETAEILVSWWCYTI